jgi:predicted oxidoreductase
MEHRSLGRTGVSVSNLCLGAMMFGEWGTKDHDESIRIIHRVLDAGINFIDTADVRLLGGGIGGDRRQGARRRQARERGSRQQGSYADGR